MLEVKKFEIPKWYFHLPFLLFFTFNLSAQTPQPKPERGFKYIFNGKDLTNWDGDPKHWSVEDGALTGVADGTLKMNSFIIWRGGTAVGSRFN